MGRTKKNIKLKIPEKPRKIKGFRLGGYPIATTISSQPRYDHFDTASRWQRQVRKENYTAWRGKLQMLAEAIPGAACMTTIHIGQREEKG